VWDVVLVEERVVDEKGRLYLGRRLGGRRLYLVRAGGVVVVADSRERAEWAARALAEKVLDEYLGLLERLGEPSPEEVEEAARERQWRTVEAGLRS
jgi:hypothetical protein